jgi:hypothetical protein
MATSGTQGLLRQSISSKRAQRTITAIETVIGTTISSNTSNNTSSEKTLSKQELGKHIQGSLDKADKR